MVREKKLKLGPKKPAVAFIWFTIKHREAYKVEHPSFGVTELGKLFGQRWRALNDKSKKKYETLAAKDKARYVTEEAEWKTNHPEEVQLMAQQKKRLRDAKNEPAKKAKTGPKKPLSAFMYFSQERRATVRLENPNIGFGEVAKKLGLIWQNMTDRAKMRYLALSEQDKVRYKDQMALERESQAKQALVAVHTERTVAPSKKKKKTGPKQPMSAFMYFCQRNRAAVKQQNPGLSFGEVARALGQLWKNMSENNKMEYVSLADEDKMRYRRELAEAPVFLPEFSAASWVSSMASDRSYSMASVSHAVPIHADAMAERGTTATTTTATGGKRRVATPWTHEENALLLKLRDEEPPVSYTVIAKRLNNMLDRDCRDRKTAERQHKRLLHAGFE